MSLIKHKVQGIPMYLNVKDGGISRTLYRNGGREPCFMHLIDHHAKGVALDIGANIGYTTLRLAKRCKKVFALEPDKRSYKILRKNIELNKLEGYIIPHATAISDREEDMEIFLSSKPNLTSLCANTKKVMARETIHATTIDEFCRTYNIRPTFMKMDIEGGETAALRGGIGIINTAHDMTILIEVHPQFYGPDNDFAGVVKEILNRGYMITHVVNAKGHRKTVQAAGLEMTHSFKDCERSIFEATRDYQDQILEWIGKMPESGGKVLRAIMIWRMESEKFPEDQFDE